MTSISILSKLVCVLYVCNSASLTVSYPVYHEWDNNTNKFEKKSIELPSTAKSLQLGFLSYKSAISDKFQSTSHLKIQDTMIHNVFSGKRGGFYVDLAANHYMKRSNTYGLERGLQWNGICIEANQSYLTELLENRRCSIYVNPVSNRTGELIQFSYGYGKLGAEYGGIIGEEFDPKPNRKHRSIVPMYTVTLTDILDNAKAPTVIDFLSLDVEGAEYHVLQGIDYDRYTFLTITVERPTEAVHRLLSDNKYRFVKQLIEFGDCLYIHPSLPNYQETMLENNNRQGGYWHRIPRAYLAQPPWRAHMRMDGAQFIQPHEPTRNRRLSDPLLSSSQIASSSSSSSSSSSAAAAAAGGGRKKNPLFSHGAIVGLMNNNPTEVIIRNKSLWRWMLEGVPIQLLPDIVIFHDQPVTAEARQQIFDATPTLPIKFVLIQFDNFVKYADPAKPEKGFKEVYPHCVESARSNAATLGYKNMCRFWFLGFIEYVDAYDWVLRLDFDCELVADAKSLLFDMQHRPRHHHHQQHHHHHQGTQQPLDDSSTKTTTTTAEASADAATSSSGTSDSSNGAAKGMQIYRNSFRNVIVASPVWLPLHHQQWDRIATLVDGVVVYGMGKFVRDFAREHDNNNTFDSWNSPYTNAMYINMKLLRSKLPFSSLVRTFMSEVDNSNCIYRNRWGDLDLWGAALALVDQPVAFLPLQYYHLSHNVIIKDDVTDGTPRRDMKMSLMYASHLEDIHTKNVSMNTRIDVEGKQGMVFSAHQCETNFHAHGNLHAYN